MNQPVFAVAAFNATEADLKAGYDKRRMKWLAQMLQPKTQNHVLLTWPLPPSGSRDLSQPVAGLHYRNSIGPLICNTLASPCQIPSAGFFLYQMSMRDKSKRFRKHSSKLGHYSLGRKFPCLNLHDLAAESPLVFQSKIDK